MDRTKKEFKAVSMKIAVPLWTAAFLLLIFGLFRISYLWSGDSDNAFLAITGNAVLHGNILLHGYYLSSLVTYFPFDIYLNAVFVKIFGFNMSVIHLAPMAIFMAFLITSIFLVRNTGDAESDKKFFSVRVFMIAVFFAMPGRAFAFWILQELHLSSVVMSMLTFMLLEKTAGGIRGGTSFKTFFLVFPVLILFLMPLFIMNSGLFIIICILPVLSASLLYIFLIYKKYEALGARGAGSKIFAESKPYLLLISLTVLSAAIEKIILIEIRKWGGFIAVPSGLPIAFVSMSNLPHNFYLFFNGILKILGVYFFGKNLFSVASLFAILKMSGILVFIYGIVSGLKKIKNPEPEDFIDLMLLSGVLFLVIAFLFSQMAVSKASARYLIPVVIFGFLLAFRNIENIKFIRRNFMNLKLKIAAAFIFIVYAASFTVNAGAVAPNSPFVPLSRWLEKHKLTYGYAPYMDAGIITLTSKGRVKVRQVRTNFYMKILPYDWVSKENWYKKKAFFIIYSKNFIYDYVDMKSAVKTFGKPSEVYTEDFQGTIGRAYGRPDGRYTMPPYVILVYKKGIKLK